jgi:deoxyribose-phosphate aldolase
LEKQNLASRIDHTILKPDAARDQVLRLCAEAREYGFASVCVNPCYVPLVREALAGSGVKVCAVAGFPLGASRPEVKAFEAAAAVREGAGEVDMVINVGLVKDGDYQALEHEVKEVVKAVKDVNPEALVKVIIETCLLTGTEKEEVCRTLLKTGADFVKTSTGFSTGGAAVEDVALIRRIVGNKMRIKASGGIRSYERAAAMVQAGADRLGTSNGIAIVS